MRKITASLITITALLAVQVAWAGHPTAKLTSFDSSKFLYTYTVTLDQSNSWAFGQFQVDAMVPCIGYTGPWVLQSPTDVATGVDLGWDKGVSRYDYSAQPKDFAFWRADITQEFAPGVTKTLLFKLYAPNTAPCAGWIMTKDGVAESENHVYDLVPGAVPEPSSIAGMALGLTSVLGSLGLGLKRNKKY